jgi:glycine/D-amino acid oxidase-like deaminating enzyme
MQRVVIIGGGVIGSSIAYHLTRHPGFDGSVVVIERDPAYTRASSALSASSIRVQFSTPVNIALSQFGLAFLKAAETALAVDGSGPVLGLREPGYLYAVPEAGLADLHANHAVQREAGADVALLDPGALAERFPWLSTDGVALGSLGLSGEGWFNGPALHMALRAKAIAQGAVFLSGEATGFERRRGRIFAVQLGSGGFVPSDIVVNAAGGWAWRVAAWAGIDLPIRPRARQVFTFSCRAELPRFPLLIDPTGIWVRPEGNLYLTGFSPAAGEADPDEAPLVIDETVFEQRLWPVLAARVPAFETLKLTGGWAGYYEMNLLDQNGLVGPHPDVPELIHAAGFSGHGMQHSPGVGRGVAELIAEGRYRTLDLSPLATSRLVSGTVLRERCVI